MSHGSIFFKDRKKEFLYSFNKHLLSAYYIQLCWVLEIQLKNKSNNKGTSDSFTVPFCPIPSFSHPNFVFWNFMKNFVSRECTLKI